MTEGRLTLIMLLIVLCCYVLTNYGGVRSPDNEVVFRVGESLSSSLSFHVSKPLSWQEFGIARGLDGRYYSIFGPGESIIIAPLIKVSNFINSTYWYDGISLSTSHYVDNGLNLYLRNQNPKEIKPHALRFTTSYFYIFVSLISVIVFLLIMKRYFSYQSAIIVSFVYALGTIAWSYSGTLFSEQLTTCLTLISFFFLINEPKGYKKPLLSGLFLGIATMCHITSILFSPFFFACLLLSSNKRRVNNIIAFTVGLLIPLLALGYYNLARFGNLFETGRTAALYGESRYVYSHFVAPWQGLYGLLLSSGKGLLTYSPAVILGLLCWKHFYKKNKKLSVIILTMILFRVIFIASRSDWPGGFCLGPRYLIPIIPFCIFPIGFWLDRQIENRRRFILAGFLIFTFLCILQQFYFNLGEIFSYYHIVKLKYLSAGIDIFTDHQIYLKWNISPIFHLLKAKSGPFLMRLSQSTAEFVTWFIAVLIVCSILLIGLILKKASKLRR